MLKCATLYDFATDPIWISLHMRKIGFSFHQCWGLSKRARQNELERTKYGIYLAHGDGDVDAEIPVVGEELGDARVEDEAIGIQDGGRDALVNGARRCLPRQAPPVPVQF